MIRNKLDGIKPFNGFSFRNCYWHQLIAGLSCLGIDGDNVLINSMAFAKEDFGLDESGILPTKEFEKFFGYRCRRCGVTERSLVRNIDRGRPMMLGVDCFFLEGRTDTYHRLHEPHFVLLYGYDLEKRIAFVVDHNYRNGFDFAEKTASLDNILLANRMYKKYIRRTHFTSRVLYLSEKSCKNENLLAKIDKNRLISGRNCSKNNLKTLRWLLTEEIQTLKYRADDIVKYLRTMRISTICLSKAQYFKTDEKRNLPIERMVNGYSNLFAVVLKMERQNNFEYALKWRENISRKLDELEEAEEEVYKLLLEVIHESI